jgi:carbon storage regulator
MLVLSRNNGESIQIGENITVTVLEADRKQAKVGIDAPKNLQIKRTNNKRKEVDNEQKLS